MQHNCAVINGAVGCAGMPGCDPQWPVYGNENLIGKILRASRHVDMCMQSVALRVCNTA